MSVLDTLKEFISGENTRVKELEKQVKELREHREVKTQHIDEQKAEIEKLENDLIDSRSNENRLREQLLDSEHRIQALESEQKEAVKLIREANREHAEKKHVGEAAIHSKKRK